MATLKISDLSVGDWVEIDHCGYLHECFGEELIDALYDMVVKLKEEGVI